MADIDALVELTGRLRRHAKAMDNHFGPSETMPIPMGWELEEAADALEAERSKRVRLEEALRAADYLIDRYRSVHSGQRVRDLDEAEVSYSCARAALSHSSSKGRATMGERGAP